jgi:hypothetical protein
MRSPFAVRRAAAWMRLETILLRLAGSTETNEVSFSWSKISCRFSRKGASLSAESRQTALSATHEG